MSPFVFTADVSSLLGKDSFLVDIPQGLNNKTDLLSYLAKALAFPHFGGNWDALDDCMRDLSWITKHEIIIYHHEIPLSETPPDQKIYIACLADMVRDWKSDRSHELTVVFNPACELEIRRIIRDN